MSTWKILLTLLALIFGTLWLIYSQSNVIPLQLSILLFMVSWWRIINHRSAKVPPVVKVNSSD
jgi:hypothetical protein